MMLQDPSIGKAQHPQTYHGEALEPQQLSRLLDWLMQASPAILVRPQAAASSSVAGATRKDGEMMQWLCQTVLSREGSSRSALCSTSLLGTRRRLHPHRFVGVVCWASSSPADITVPDPRIIRSSDACRSITSSSEALAWALEVAAQQLTSQRLRTHYGGAVQTFAALEKGLQSRLTKCRQAEEQRQPVPGVVTACHRTALSRPSRPAMQYTA